MTLPSYFCWHTYCSFDSVDLQDGPRSAWEDCTQLFSLKHVLNYLSRPWTHLRCVTILAGCPLLHKYTALPWRKKTVWKERGVWFALILHYKKHLCKCVSGGTGQSRWVRSADFTSKDICTGNYYYLPCHSFYIIMLISFINILMLKTC